MARKPPQKSKIVKGECCTEFTISGGLATLPIGRLIANAALIADPKLAEKNGGKLATSQITFGRSPAGRRKIIIRLCGGDLSNVDDLVNISDKDVDHPSNIIKRMNTILNPPGQRKTVGPRGRGRKRVPIPLNPRFRCKCPGMK